jgi:hypothetical protein
MATMRQGPGDPEMSPTVTEQWKKDAKAALIAKHKEATGREWGWQAACSRRTGIPEASISAVLKVSKTGKAPVGSSEHAQALETDSGVPLPFVARDRSDTWRALEQEAAPLSDEEQRLVRASARALIQTIRAERSRSGKGDPVRTKK